jgi:hypothetical protein
VMVAALRGELLQRPIESLGSLIKCVPFKLTCSHAHILIYSYSRVDRDLPNAELVALVDVLNTFFDGMSPRVWEEEGDSEGAISKIIEWMSAMPADGASPVDELAGDVGKWLVDYFRWAIPLSFFFLPGVSTDKWKT